MTYEKANELLQGRCKEAMKTRPSLYRITGTAKRAVRLEGVVPLKRGDVRVIYRFAEPRNIDALAAREMPAQLFREVRFELQ